MYKRQHQISQEHFGKTLTIRQLADIFLRLQDQGAHNINLVTATQYLPWILPALDLAKERLSIPVVYNCGGYERTETVKALKAVSYTHLDVYKRQIFHLTLRLPAQRISPPAPDPDGFHR